MKANEIRQDAMRIAGGKVFANRTIDVFNPATGDLMGTVPRASVDDVRRAFAVARNYRAKLTRYDRSEILKSAARSCAARTRKSPPCSRHRAWQARTLDGARVRCPRIRRNHTLIETTPQHLLLDLTPHGKNLPACTQCASRSGAISASRRLNHPLIGVAPGMPSIATTIGCAEALGESACLRCVRRYSYEHLAARDVVGITRDPKEIGDDLITNPVD